ncbi:interleukin 12 receptor, beta 2a, like isoform X2 [Sphaeramia orbicularis]|uniref:Interleukin-12 receptor subunit beta-2-like n=1 Tax=Sphaeramia orbicularis TaxID=375764 RepID=A0A673AES0_9TELE|nr:interleukin-12 receptor subunit beta-2-like isoform X2 [Sphaeramia orbicularis]
MATFRTGWLLSILLANLANCSPHAGRPVPPSHVSCHIPCNENSCDVDIHCFWDQPDLQPNTTYSLHWESAGREKSGNSSNGLIQREHFSSHSKLRVWVQAKNQYGSEKSPEVVFNNTADIIKPHPPKDILSYQEPLEIEWKSTCEQLQLSVGNCEVRHQAETDQAWIQDEGGISANYALENSQPCTVYAFQVRCACNIGLMSDWSETHRIKRAERAPIGKVDVWRDCGISPTSSDCILTWKRLPISHACGDILGYEVRLFYNSSTEKLLNEPAAEPMVHLVCDEMQCHLNYSLKGVSSVNVSAYNALGATFPTHLDLPMSGEENNDQAIELEMKEKSLTVSWDVTSQLSDNLKEYVVQYKQAGSPLGEGFDWVRVEKSQRTGVFKGQFKKYTPYQVSLFTELHSGKGRYLSSNIAHFVQGSPSRVRSFKVLSSSSTHVTLFWEPVLMSKQNGVTPYYQIGVNQQNVYTVSAYPQHKNRTYELPNLTQGQEYEAWIRAVNGAGPGPNTTTHFNTERNEAYLIIVLWAIVVIVIIIPLAVLVFFRCPLVPSFLHEKVPDPRNSHIFCQMTHQSNDFLPWICIPVHEPHPKISLLEVVEIPPWASRSPQETTSQTDGLTRPLVGNGNNETDNALPEESETIHHKYGREEYSKMVDSDEERDKENEEEGADSWSCTEEDLLSGYEKHFMPTVLEILEV